MIFENGVAGAEPPTGTRGGSPTLSPGTDAGRVCRKALQDAKPTKRSYRDREFALSYKKQTFYTS